jgi:hypothetical protein
LSEVWLLNFLRPSISKICWKIHLYTIHWIDENWLDRILFMVNYLYTPIQRLRS